MSSEPFVLEISAESSGSQLELAVERLTTGPGVVLLNDTVALRRAPTGLICEVLDPASSSRRCEHELEVMVENAQRMLRSSTLGQRLFHVPLQWRVVEEDESHVELWRPRRSVEP